MNYIKKNLSKDAAENFENEYDKNKIRAKELKLNNAEKIALLSAMIKMSIDVE